MIKVSVSPPNGPLFPQGGAAGAAADHASLHRAERRQVGQHPPDERPAARELRRAGVCL